MKSTDTSTRNATPQCRQPVPPPPEIREMIDKAKDVNKTADSYTMLDMPHRKAVFVLGNAIAEKGDNALDMQKLEAKDLPSDWWELPVAKRRTIAYGMADSHVLSGSVPYVVSETDITRSPPGS